MAAINASIPAMDLWALEEDTVADNDDDRSTCCNQFRLWRFLVEEVEGVECNNSSTLDRKKFHASPQWLLAYKEHAPLIQNSQIALVVTV